MENVVEEPALKYNYISPEEYLEQERAAPDKHEYYQGEIFAMSGTSIRHSRISTDLSGELVNRLKGKPCQSYNNNIRIHIPKNTLYTYPDLSIICGKPETTDDHFDTITNPSVIFEVLSKSTASYDLGRKFSLYQQIETLKEYIVVDSQSVFVRKHTRNADNSWQTNDYHSIDDVFNIDTVQLSIALQTVYENISFV